MVSGMRFLESLRQDGSRFAVMQNTPLGWDGLNLGLVDLRRNLFHSSKHGIFVRSFGFNSCIWCIYHKR